MLIVDYKLHRLYAIMYCYCYRDNFRDWVFYVYTMSGYSTTHRSGLYSECEGAAPTRPYSILKG